MVLVSSSDEPDLSVSEEVEQILQGLDLSLNLTDIAIASGKARILIRDHANDDWEPETAAAV